MPKELQLQKIEKAKGRALLNWAGKKPLEAVNYFPAQEKEIYGDKKSVDFNKLFWGDNLQVLSHLLKDYRSKVDLIYIDPPFDSKADYVRQIKLRGEKISGTQQSLIEEKQYSDIWEKDEYLQFMYERLLLMRELLKDEGSIYLHCDWHKGAYLRLIMDEVFGEDNFQREIIWGFENISGFKSIANNWIRAHDTILFYTKGKKPTFNKQYIPYSEDYLKNFDKTDEHGKKYWQWSKTERRYLNETKGGIPVGDVWDIKYENNMSANRTNYPTQKPEELLERIIKGSSNEGDVILDCFSGSGTTLAVAQKLGRKWIGCDINLGAIQTATKRINQIISDQIKEKNKSLKGSLGFKVFNVNDYDVFKNGLEAQEIIMETYGIEPIKRNYFDGILNNSYVKIMPINRVLNKLDIRSVLKNVSDRIGDFKVKRQSKSGEAVYEEGVIVICSGMELEVPDFLRKENKTGVKVEIRDITTDKNNLVFKKLPEAEIEVKNKGKNLTVDLKEFYSPILMRKLEVENAKAIKKEYQTKVENFKQIIDSVAIDVDYDGKLFNAEIMDLPTKNELIKVNYTWEYPKAGKYTVAVKVIDVLGEEYFETFNITA